MKCFKKVTLSGDLTDKNKTWTTYFTSSDHHHGMYSDICSDIMSEYFWHIFWQSIWRDFYLTFYVAFKLAFYLTFVSEIEPGKLSCIKMAFCLTHFLTCSLAYFPACLRMPEVSRFHERCDSSSFFLLVPSCSFFFLLLPSSSFFFLVFLRAFRELQRNANTCRELQLSLRAHGPEPYRELRVRLGTHGPEAGHTRTRTYAKKNVRILSVCVCQAECKIDSQKIWQIECQQECQIECQQEECQIECRIDVRKYVR